MQLLATRYCWGDCSANFRKGLAIPVGSKDSHNYCVKEFKTGGNSEKRVGQGFHPKIPEDQQGNPLNRD